MRGARPRPARLLVAALAVVVAHPFAAGTAHADGLGIRITSPADGAVVPMGDVDVVAALTYEGDRYPDSTFFVDGAHLGGFAGEVTWDSRRSPGVHTLTAEVYQDGETARHSITVRVPAPPPDVQLSSDSGTTVERDYVLRVAASPSADAADDWALRSSQVCLQGTSRCAAVDATTGLVAAGRLEGASTPGEHVLVARVVDNYGAEALSVPLRLTVREPARAETPDEPAASDGGGPGSEDGAQPTGGVEADPGEAADVPAPDALTEDAPAQGDLVEGPAEQVAESSEDVPTEGAPYVVPPVAAPSSEPDPARSTWSWLLLLCAAVLVLLVVRALVRSVVTAVRRRAYVRRPLAPGERERLLGGRFDHDDRPEPRQDDDAAWLDWHHRRVDVATRYWDAYRRLHPWVQQRLHRHDPYRPPVVSAFAYLLADAKGLYPHDHAWQLEHVRERQQADRVEQAAWETARSAARAAAAAQAAARTSRAALHEQQRHHHHHHHGGHR